MTARAVLRPQRDEVDPSGGAATFDSEAIWGVLLAARRAADGHEPPGRLGFAQVGRDLEPAPQSRTELQIDLAGAAVIQGLERCDPSARDLLDLFLDLAVCPPARSHVTCILGQSLDGCIATRAGESRCVNGPASLDHQHRLRALSDAVVIGAATAIADRPRLTTRHVAGPNPVRVVIDPRRRLPRDHCLLNDGLAPTLILHAAHEEGAARRLTDQATAVGVPVEDGELCPRRIVAILRARGLARIMVEGGGVTVTRFIAAGAVDRLQLAVAPLLLGNGLRALSLPGVDRLVDAPRPACRNYRFDDDVLFDLRLKREP